VLPSQGSIIEPVIDLLYNLVASLKGRKGADLKFATRLALGFTLSTALLVAAIQPPVLAGSPYVVESTRKTYSASKQYVIKGKDTTYVALEESQLAKFLYSMTLNPK
jgi:hypothetical protein